MRKKNVVVIGGGTGTHTVLQGLKQYQDTLNLSAVVTMADSGGSTGRLRDEFGQLPVGDVRMALTALSKDDDEHEELLRELFLYRFDRGEGLSGHNFGNLLLVALTDILGSEEAAIRSASKILRVEGQVLPVSTSPADLVATYADGVTIVGEHDIDEPSTDRLPHAITNIEVGLEVTISSSACAAIELADTIIFGPGDLYTSILANVVVPGVTDAIQSSEAQLIYVSNLMTKSGQTTGYGLKDHVSELSRYVGCRPDVVIANQSPLPNDLVSKYADENEFPVEIDMLSDSNTVVSLCDVLANEEVTTVQGDVLKRSLIRHDSHKLASQVVSLIT